MKKENTLLLQTDEFQFLESTSKNSNAQVILKWSILVHCTASVLIRQSAAHSVS